MKLLNMLGLLLVISCPVRAGDNLLLAHADEKGYPNDRPRPKNGSVKLVADKLNITLPAGSSSIYKIYITPEIKALAVTGKLKAEDIVSGKADWQNGRISTRFIKRDGKVLLWVPADHVSGKSTKIVNRVYMVPEGAYALLVEPANLGVGGILQVSDLAVTNTPSNLLTPPNINSVPVVGLEKKGIKALWEDNKLCINIDGNGALQRHLAVMPHWKSVHLSFKIRYSNVVKGDKNWKDARISCRFLDSKYKAVGPWPENFHFTGTLETWKTYSRTYSIPEGAAYLRLEPANFGSSGKVEFKDLALTIVD